MRQNRGHHDETAYGGGDSGMPGTGSKEDQNASDSMSYVPIKLTSEAKVDFVVEGHGGNQGLLFGQELSLEGERGMSPLSIIQEDMLLFMKALRLAWHRRWERYGHREGAVRKKEYKEGSAAQGW